MSEIDKIISFVTEEEDDSDWKDLVHDNTWAEGDAWMKNTLEPLGFKYRSMGCRGWEKIRGDKMASVGSSTTPGKLLITLYAKTGLGRWLQDTYAVKEYDHVLPTLRAWGILKP